METQTPVTMPSDIDTAPIGKHARRVSVTPIRTRALSTNSYETTEAGNKEISDEQQDLFRKKHDVHDKVSPTHVIMASPHKIGQKAIVMPKAMAL
ncbi:hypothetical protein ACHHYP_00557 [Achlya hypogyna]|uniref:Uncharacterized protein n=1 Tax=Achlya hypogyna TaxID=1202772 RepID=A0A1V9ZU81_ACHHY|nr:hypothetical protein ACHHYP_00557 [Achlya hypogyna]